MGGFGSGLQLGKPIVEMSLVIDLAWMLRTGRANPGSNIVGRLDWFCRSQPLVQVDYTALMATPGDERLEIFICGEAEQQQTVRLRCTVPPYGGKRWWMICPYRGLFVSKLYRPPGAHAFASRQVYGLGYRSERATEQARALDRLFALQRKLNSLEGLGVFPPRPKGMWLRTYDRHMTRYWELEEAACSEILSSVRGRDGLEPLAIQASQRFGSVYGS